jgi:hypothetical protein
MPLTIRPSGLASTGYYKDHADYLIFCGGWNIGRIYEIRSAPEELRCWFWALHFPSRPENLRTDNRAGSLKAAKEEFEECWRKCGRRGRSSKRCPSFRPCPVCNSPASQSFVDLVEQHARLPCGHLTLIRPDLAPLRRGFSLPASGCTNEAMELAELVLGTALAIMGVLFWLYW